MALHFSIKTTPLLLLLWGSLSLLSQEPSAPIVVTHEATVVDVFSRESSYERPLEITTYFDTLHLVAGATPAIQYSLDFHLPGSPLAFQNTQRAMVLSLLSGTVDCRYEKQYGEGHVDRAYVRILFLLTKPDVPDLPLPPRPLCWGSSFRLQAGSEWAERYEFQASMPGVMVGSLLMIPEAGVGEEPLRIRSRAGNFHGTSEWSAWREVPVSRLIGGLEIEGASYLPTQQNHLFALRDDNSGRGLDLLADSETTYTWSLSPPTHIEGNNSPEIAFSLPPGYGVLECLVSNPRYCRDTTLRRGIIGVEAAAHGLPEIAIEGEYARSEAPFALYLRNVSSEQPTEWYLNTLPLPPAEGLFFVNPAHLPQGVHHLRTLLSGKLSIETWFTVE